MSTPPVHKFLRKLMIAVTNASIYTMGHQQSLKMMGECFDAFREVCGRGQDVSIMTINDQIFASGQSVPESPHISRLARIMRATGVESIRIDAAAAREELAHLISLLARLIPALTPRAAPHIKLGTIEIRRNGGNESASSDSACRTVEEMARRECATMNEVFDTLVKKKKLLMSGVREVVTSVIDVFTQDAGAIMALAPLKAMQQYAFVHSTNVCILNILQARALGVDKELLHDIGIAALLHDIGKMFIPADLLDKAGKPTDEEWRLIRDHPVRGARYLAEAPDVPELAVIVAYEHHMQYNLSGYPRVSPTWKQHLCSQMTALSDRFDAMRTHRSYRRAMNWEEIHAVFSKASGTELHPMLANNFLLLIDSVRRQKVAV